MTDDQINAAIHASLGDPKSCQTPKSRQTCCCDECFYNKGLNYCADLNAMHEAEKALAPKNWNRFSEKWWNYYHHLSDGDAQKTIHATARQRARAFLETLGLWDNGSA